MKVRKAVIPVAGFGTRFLPATKSVPKAMLPIIAKPVIHYIIEVVVASGVRQIILVTGRNKSPLEDYFKKNLELEEALERSGKTDVLAEVRSISDLADIQFVEQEEALGNGHAVMLAKDLVGDEAFLMLWGDDVLLGEPPIPRQLIDVAERLQGPVIGVRQVPPTDFGKYGMLAVEAVPGEQPSSRVSRALKVVEKPAPGKSPSNLAQIGGFVLTPDIFALLESTRAGHSGEIWLADALDRLMQLRPVYAYEFEGTRYDAGNKLDFLRATVELAMNDPELGDDFRAYLASRVDPDGRPAVTGD